MTDLASLRSALFAAVLALLLILADLGGRPPSAPSTQLAFPFYVEAPAPVPSRTKSIVQDTIAAWRYGRAVRRNRRYLRAGGAGTSLSDLVSMARA